MDETTDAMTQTAETPQVAPAETTPDAATQAAEATPTTPEDAGQVDQSPPTRKSLRELLAEDPELQREYDEDHNRRIQKANSKRDRELEKQRLTRAVEDPVEALTLAQERKQKLDTEDAAETGLTAKWAAVDANVKATAKENPSWGEDYETVVAANRKEANELFAKDPDAYEKWIDKQIYKLDVKREVEKDRKERMPTLVEAASLDKTNQALRNVPQLPTGNGGTSDAALLASVNNMSGQEYLANKERIYAAIRRKQG